MRFLSLLLLCSSLFADPLNFFKSDLLQSVSLDAAISKVDIMTGTYIEDALDLVVAGSDPLSIRRFYYASAPIQDTRYGFWHFNPESLLTANFAFNDLPRFASVGQFSGNMVQLTHGDQTCYQLQKNAHTAYGGVSHPLNTRVTYSKIMDPKNDERFRWEGSVTDGSGSKRSFVSATHCWHKENKKVDPQRGKPHIIPTSSWIPYHLFVQEERRPNGNIMVYEPLDWRSEEIRPWPKLIKKITLYNSTKTRELASLTFDYHQPYSWDLRLKYPKPGAAIYDLKVEEVSSFTITGSDGRKVFYQNSRRSIERQPVVLKSVQTPQDTYLLDYDYYTLKRLQKSGITFRTEYDSKGRVSAQYSPVGLIAKYAYHTNMTEVTDGRGHKTRYFFDTRINRIEREDSIEENTWDPVTGNLLSYTLSDKQGKCLLKKTFTYDKNHNPITEMVGERTIHRTYSDDGFNLLLSESDREEAITCYHYLPNTNLMTAKLFYEKGSIRKRTFYEYDDCAICIRTIMDDGSSEDSQDIRGITYRKITEITPKYTKPCFGLPEIIQEKTIDGTGREILLGKIKYTYAPSGQILTEEHYDAEGVYRYTIKNRYDGKERLSSSTDPLGNITFFAYDERGNLISIKGPRSDQHKKITYDNANRPIRIEEAGQVTERGYDILGNLISETDPYGNTTHFDYDSEGRIIATHYPDGAVEQKEYDALGNVIKEIDGEGYITKTIYNCHSQPISVFYPDGSEEHFTYNPTGTLATHTDKNGATTSYTYDVFDHLIETRTEDKITTATWSPFCKLSETDGEGITTFYTYDFCERKLSEQTDNKKSSYSYDALGNLSLVDEGVFYTIYTYDEGGQLLSKSIWDDAKKLQFQESYAYDEAGNRIQHITSQGSFETLFDSLGRKIQEKDPLGFITAYFYSDSDHTVTITDAKGTKTVKVYDTRGREIEVAKADFLQCKSYDNNGNCISCSYPLQGITHTWKYGPDNKVLSFLEAGQKQRDYHYNSRGLLQTLIKPSGTEIHYEWDNLGRLSRLYSHDFDEHYTYDHNDRLLSVYDALSHEKTTRGYDALGNLTHEELYTGVETTYAYDNHGRKIKCTLPDGSNITYTYQGKYLSEVHRKNHVFAYESRDLGGHILEVSLPQKLGKILYKRDGLSRVKDIKTSFYQAHLTYDPVGNLLSYRYNDPLGSIEDHYSYDDLGHLISENEHSYTCDPLHNRLSRDQLSHTVNTLCQLTHDGENDYTYDLDGNLTSDGNQHYTYDSRDRLIAVDDGRQRVEYAYDSFHRRLSKRVFIQSKQISHEDYLWDGDNEIGMVDEQGSIKQLRILGEGLKAEIGAAVLYELLGKSYLPLHDHRGNVVTLIDLKTTKPTEVYRYTAFGEKPTDDPLSPWRFASKRTDPETGFIFFGRRYYTPHLGRWITPDPQDFADGPNLYSYLKHCPMSDIDPYGLWSWKLWDKDLLAHPRMQGGLQALWGLAEAGAGGGMTLASGSMAAPVGLPIMAHGLDQFFTGMHKAVFGGYRETATSQLLQKTGLSPRAAGLTNEYLSLFGTLGGAGAFSKISRPFFPVNKNICREISHSNPLQGTKYTRKVLLQMENNLKTGKPDLHGFPRIVDNYAGLGRKELIQGKDGISRIKISLEGCYKSQEGHFEWILEADQSVNHRIFIPNP